MISTQSDRLGRGIAMALLYVTNKPNGGNARQTTEAFPGRRLAT
jgi:hypothetical protein